jgi:uncharacterized protein (UPF0297 family)
MRGQTQTRVSVEPPDGVEPVRQLVGALDSTDPTRIDRDA